MYEVPIGKVSKEYHIDINVLKSPLTVKLSTYIKFMNPGTLQVTALMPLLFLLIST